MGKIFVNAINFKTFWWNGHFSTFRLTTISLCTESRWVNNVKMKIQTSFNLFSVHKGHAGHEPRYHPLEPAKQGFPGRNMKPREQDRKGQNPMLLGIAICWSPQAWCIKTFQAYKKMPKNALMYELFISKVEIPLFPSKKLIALNFWWRTSPQEALAKCRTFCAPEMSSS